MQLKKFWIIAVSLAVVIAQGYTPGEQWSSLTPSATFSCAATEFTSTFGIAVQTISTDCISANKRDLISQIGDGQIQVTAVPTKTGLVFVGESVDITTTLTRTSIITVRERATTTYVGYQASSFNKNPVSILSSSLSLPSVISFIFASKCQTTAVVSLKNGSCSSDSTLKVTLMGGILTDSQGRIGSIVANRQFQFDGPTPQAGTIYAAGWSITPEGNLALGDEDVFYQCLSGDFYNLYDQKIGEQCSRIHLQAVSLISC